ncbi:MAG: hypothetical protein ABSF03_26220 [Streptosporangiaceae bacterium]
MRLDSPDARESGQRERFPEHDGENHERAGPASRVSASTLLPPLCPPEDRMLAPVTRIAASVHDHLESLDP